MRQLERELRDGEAAGAEKVGGRRVDLPRYLVIART